VSEALFIFALALVAVLYSAVGQAGGTGYIAVMGLAGLAPDVIKPAALALNILVAAIGSARFYAAGLLTWRSCYPFAIFGAPFSLLGGALQLPSAIYHPVVGGLLLLAAVQLMRSVKSTVRDDRDAPEKPPFVPALAIGGVIGLVSGMTGVGGGIFLAPLVLMFGWSETRQAAAISAMFNLLNSAAGLAGLWTAIAALPSQLPLWLIAVGIGGLLGSWLGVRFLQPATLRIVLAGLLLAAGLRMMAAPLL
jgi:uncharacterized membrane protein YfcA